MKRNFLGFGLLSVLAFAGTMAASQAGVYVGVGFGSGYHHSDWCGRGYYYGPGYAPYYAPPVYVAPSVVYTESTPVVVEQPAPVVVQSQPTTVVQAAPPSTTTTTTTATPASGITYGYLQGNGTVRSPYSDFSLPVSGHNPGDVVYDANNGKPFKIP